MSYDRDYTIFFRRPISLAILILTVVLLVSMMRLNKRIEKANAEQEAEMAANHQKFDAEAIEKTEHNEWGPPPAKGGTSEDDDADTKTDSAS